MIAAVPRIAVPVIASTMEEALADIDAAAAVADIVELRIDYMKEKPDLERLMRRSTKPVIVTNRHPAEDGKFHGSEEERVAYLQQAIKLGAAYVDIELNYFNRLTIKHPTQLIVSYHDTKVTLDNMALCTIYLRMLKAGANIAKITTTANNSDDSARMLELIAKISSCRGKVVGICMGEEGKPTRIHGPAYGSQWTYASLEGKPSAPGQPTVAELRAAWKSLGIE